MGPHGRYPNGLRKVEITDNLGRVTTLRVSGAGTLAEALALAPIVAGEWGAVADAIPAAAKDYWRQITWFRAVCGAETYTHHFELDAGA